MKALILVVIISINLLASEHKILIHGLTNHFKIESTYKTNTGSNYNETNEGIGYEYTTFNDDSKVFYNLSGSVLNDSFYNAQYSLVVGANTILLETELGDIQVGANIGVAYKKVSIKETKYYMLPIVFPRVTLKTKIVDFNIVAIPSVSAFGLVGFVHYSIGINL